MTGTPSGESADIVVFPKGGLAGFCDKVTFPPRLGGGWGSESCGSLRTTCSQDAPPLIWICIFKCPFLSFPSSSLTPVGFLSPTPLFLWFSIFFRPHIPGSACIPQDGRSYWPAAENNIRSIKTADYFENIDLSGVILWALRLWVVWGWDQREKQLPCYS